MNTTAELQNIHSSFTLERTYDAPVGTVYEALSDEDAMATWFGDPTSLEADGDRTHLVHTEQGVFLDGLDTSEIREYGTNELLDALGRAVSR